MDICGGLLGECFGFIRLICAGVLCRAGLLQFSFNYRGACLPLMYVHTDESRIHSLITNSHWPNYVVLLELFLKFLVFRSDFFASIVKKWKKLKIFACA